MNEPAALRLISLVSFGCFYLTQVIAHNDEGVGWVEGNVVEPSLFPRYNLLHTDSLHINQLHFARGPVLPGSQHNGPPLIG